MTPYNIFLPSFQPEFDNYLTQRLGFQRELRFIANISTFQLYFLHTQTWKRSLYHSVTTTIYLRIWRLWQNVINTTRPIFKDRLKQYVPEPDIKQYFKKKYIKMNMQRNEQKLIIVYPDKWLVKENKNIHSDKHSEIPSLTVLI